MASLDKYQTPSGDTKHRVRWITNGTRESQSFNTEKDALQWKAIIEAAGGDTARAVESIENQIEHGPTVTELLIRHIDQLTDVGDYQLSRYRKSLSQHFAGDFGAMKIRRVTSEHIVDWQRYMASKSLQAKTIANHRGLLSAAFSTGIRLRIIDHNPCAGVRLPKDNRPTEQMQIIPIDQWNDLMGVMHEHYVPFSRMLLYSGARFGELTAVQKPDFGHVGATSVLRITKAWKEDDNYKFYLGAPKTRKGKRSVSLSRQADKIMLPLLANRGDDELVFKTVFGRQIRSSAYHKIWGQAWTDLGVPKERRPRPHDIRHTHASMMLAAGMDMYELSRRLGHESVKTTVDRYSHLVEGAHARGASIADAAFG
ncbi:tyrosine-type recombinase/integrase [Glutamicibacter sp. NPDC087344]|uniref:tyrosine-type recombinase/integrase n=1 Tax=Glutamicibacter sp. NPDC087344 TaxID=3363994 RepID=UPI0037FBADEB